MDLKKGLKILLIGGSGLFLLILLLAIIFSSKNKKTSQPEISLDNNLPEAYPGEMLFILYEDANGNNQFDFSEKVFKKVAVSVRKPGEQQAFITVPADTNGLIKIDNLKPGAYEVSYSNYEAEQPITMGNLVLNQYYELIEPNQTETSLLLSDWYPVDLPDTGLRLKVGLRAYQPKSILVIKAGNDLKLYDPVRGK